MLFSNSFFENENTFSECINRINLSISGRKEINTEVAACHRFTEGAIIQSMKAARTI